MNETVWITRTQPSASESAKVWQRAGFNPLVLPLLDVVPMSHNPVREDAVLIFTSKNGVAHMVGSGQRAICVGDATAERAIRAGFKDVVSVDGTSKDITDWVKQNLSVGQPIVHVSGRHVRGSIVEDLCEAGYETSHLVVYRSEPRYRFPDSEIDHVVFYSPLAARTFAELAVNRNVGHLSSISISAAADGELERLALKNRMIADRPNEAALVSAARNA